jgi:geranylgeranyl diphosphate synthase, type II
MSGVAAGTSLVAEVLADYGALVRQRLTQYLPPREPRRYLYELVADYPARGGRMLRSSLCVAASRVFGARGDEAVGTAAAIEMLHNAFLVHDDIEDESDRRRGLPSLNALHGVPAALNAGDALAIISLAPLLDNRTLLGPNVALDILEEATLTARESVEGQAIELGWRRDNVLNLDVVDYLQMILKKTCWYTTIYPCRVGAIIGTRRRPDAAPFIRFGFFLGAAFQIQDDLLNLVGDEERYGKERDGDLWEGKRTVMMIHLFQRSTPRERAALAELLRRPRAERTDDDVRWVRERMQACGAIEYATELAQGLAGAAVHEGRLLFGGFPDSRDRRFLEALPRWVIERT